MSEEPKSIGGTLKIWFGAAGAGVTLLLSIYSLKDKLDGKTDKPAGDPAPVQVARVEVVHTGPGPAGSVAGAAPIQSSSEPVPRRGGARVQGESAAEAVANAVAPTQSPTEVPSTKKYNVSPPELLASPRLEYVRAEGRGIGPTRDDAIRRALREAGSKGLGGSFSAEVDLQIASESKSIDGETSERRTANMQEVLKMRTGGLLAWWGISEETSKSGSWDVSIKAVFVKIKPKSADPEAKWVVYVTPFKVLGGFKILADQMSPKESQQLITGAVNRQIVQSRKFGVVDRQFEKEIESLSASPGDGVLEAALRLAERSSTDFLISGEITNLEITRFKSGVGRLDKPIAQGKITYTVTDVNSSKTVFSRSISASSISSVDFNASQPAEILTEELGRIITSDILESIYPLVIAGIVGDGEVALNRGGESVKVGVRLDVFETGKKIIDPSTKEVLGDSERRVGAIEIVRVTPKVSFAKIVESSSAFKEGFVCRKQGN